MPAAPAAQALQPVHALPEAACGMCGTKNPVGERFCMACGQPLAAAAPPKPTLAPAMAAPQPTAGHAPPAPVLVAQAPAPQPVVVSHAAPVAVQPTPAPAPVFARPVIDVGASAEPPAHRVCGRCHGSNQGSSLFCRYCGASLANAQVSQAPVQHTPSPPVVAAPAPAPHAPPVVLEPPPPARVAASATIEDAQPFELPKMAAELSVEPPKVPSKDPSTERDSSARKATWLNTKSKASRGQLVVITKEGTPGPSYPIYEQADIGRSEGDIVLADDRYLSPRHARLVFREDRLFLRDLDSVNGLFLRVSALRGKKVAEIERAAIPSGTAASAVANVDSNVAMELQDQDLILIGQQVLRFEALKDGEAGLGPASEHGTLLFGTPSAPRYARLSQRTVEGVTRDVYYIRKVETVLGRESGDVVFTDDPFLSRRHAAFLVLPSSAPAPSASSASPAEATPRDRAPQANEKNRLSAAARKRANIHLVDLGSSNGTFLGLRGETEVRSGDLVRMGQQLFRIDIGGGHG